MRACIFLTSGATFCVSILTVSAFSNKVFHLFINKLNHLFCIGVTQCVFTVTLKQQVHVQGCFSCSFATSMLLLLLLSDLFWN